MSWSTTQSLIRAVRHGMRAAPPKPPADPWMKIEPPRCDVCDRRAIWAHPEGGLRCGQCPRPKTSQGGGTDG